MFGGNDGLVLDRFFSPPRLTSADMYRGFGSRLRTWWSWTVFWKEWNLEDFVPPEGGAKASTDTLRSVPQTETVPKNELTSYSGL